MKKLVFALFDTKGYMKAFSDFLLKKNFLVDSRLFTKQETLVEYLEKNQPDVLLLGEEIDGKGLRHIDQAGKVIILSEGNVLAENTNAFPLIFKYQSAEKILQEVFQIVSETEELSGLSYGSSPSGHTEFLGIYRPYGEPMPVQRVFSVNGGREKKSLFVNMELLSGLEEKMKKEQIRGMSEMIFYLKQRSEKISAKLKALVQDREGVDYIYPVEDYRDLYSIDRDDVDRLLNVLSNETGYERVVFDVGYLNDSALYLLYCCDRVYVPRAKNSWEENQKKALENLLVREGLEDVVESIRYVS